MDLYLLRTLDDLAYPSNFIPLVIICGLLLWRGRFGRLGRRITVAGTLLLLVAGVTPLGTALILPLENRFPPWDESRGAPTGIIVLGGIINPHISFMRDEIELGPAADRLVAAVELYNRYPTARIVFSGAVESRFAVRFLEDLGVPSDHIAVDNAAHNTIGSAVNDKKVADPKPGERWLLVTSAFHMPRAIGLFRAAGFLVEAYPVDWQTGGWHDLILAPSSLLSGFQRLDLATHEWEGLFINWITRRATTLFPSPADTAVAG